MGERTSISWTDHTFNPWRGCTKIDPGCKNCYMFTEQARYGKDPSKVVRTQTWRDPHRWQRDAFLRGRKDLVFTCSWSDWFHPDADEWRSEAWMLVQNCPNLIFQILTKRADRIADNLPRDWGNGYNNVWLGVSVSEQKGCWRIQELIKVPARVRFISYEPALGPVDFGDLSQISWLISGGESGPGYRPDTEAWHLSALEQCRRYGTAYFYKQSSAPKSGYAPLELPREFPR